MSAAYDETLRPHKALSDGTLESSTIHVAPKATKRSGKETEACKAAYSYSCAFFLYHHSKTRIKTVAGGIKLLVIKKEALKWKQ